MLIAVKADWSVAIVNFSSSVICLATTLFILICLSLLTSSTVSPYRNVSSVKESTQANMLRVDNNRNKKQNTLPHFLEKTVVIRHIIEQRVFCCA